MNDSYIVTTYTVKDDIMKAWGFEDDCRASGHAAETLTVAVLGDNLTQWIGETVRSACHVH